MSAEAPKAAVEDLIAKVVTGKALEAFDRCRSCRVGYPQHERGSHSGVVERKSGAREICLLIHWATRWNGSAAHRISRCKRLIGYC